MTANRIISAMMPPPSHFYKMLIIFYILRYFVDNIQQ
jgi:hypothetical protein